MYFLSFRIFEQLALALKNRVALEFFTVVKYFLSFRIFEQLTHALKTEFALKFFKSVGAAAPSDPPPRTPMGEIKRFSSSDETDQGEDQHR